MLENFNVKITPELNAAVAESGRDFSDIVIMASLIEKEAGSRKDAEIISGILWKRIEIGMPLQVDAVFPYIIGKNTYEVTLQDLEVDSPYNTYKYPGLPIGPISNPGLVSIKAAINPQKTNYLYYLNDTNGVMHYATTFDEHKINKARHVR